MKERQTLLLGEKLRVFTPCLGLFGLFATFAWSQDTGPAAFPPVPVERVARYTALRTTQQITVDGKLDEAVWKNVPRSPRFVDLISGRPTVHSTQAAVMWDDTNLYVGYWVEEPVVQAKFTQRDSPIYEDNDVELFVAGADAYYEFEVNSFGTIYEGLFIWQSAFESKGYHRIPELDQSRSDVKFQPFNGVGLTTHPRGKRWAYLKWDFPDLKSAVWIDGTINDPSDRDWGWTVELALPWKSMRLLAMADNRALPPKAGDVWRMDFSRFNQYKAAPPEKDSSGWAWSSHGVWDSHVPEVFPFITFSMEAVSTKNHE
jgi:Carbohydrate family 9 binding domain-like